MRPNLESLRSIAHRMMEQFGVQFSGCQIFQQMHPFHTIRQLYGDCVVCLVRLHSTTLLVDKVYTNYTSIVLRPFFKPGYPWAPPPFLEIVDGTETSSKWELQVAQLIIKSTKPVLVVLESVVFPEDAALHRKRICRILAHLLEISN